MNEIEKIIVGYLKKHKKKISILQISKKVDLSYATVSKYILLLELKKDIIVQDFGNVKFVSVK